MASFPGTLESNNPEGYGIVYADQVSGHKTVQNLEELNNLSVAILSKSKNNANNDAIGQIWYVIDQAKYYQLKEWSPRKWKPYEAGVNSEQLTAQLDNYYKKTETYSKDEVPTKEEFNTLSNIVGTKANIDDIPNVIAEKNATNQVELKDRITKEIIYPITTGDQVTVSGSKTLNTKLAEIDAKLIGGEVGGTILWSQIIGGDEAIQNALDWYEG